ncbi:hypothetical protein LCGC14_0661610, partial [marine sediment metagenome]
GVRVTRRTDRYPVHPADGIVVSDGIIEAAKDENLTAGQRYYYGIWTYNKETHYSRGQFISGIPQDRILPSGVNFATATPRILPGVERDDNTQIIYNFATGDGSIIFDSSENGRHGVLGSEVILDNFWSGDGTSGSTGEIRNAVGARFDGEFDIIETSVDDSIAAVGGSRAITINFWIYRYRRNQLQWIIGTSNSAPSSNAGWVIGLDADGQIRVGSGNISDNIGSSSIGLIPEQTWTMVTVTIDLSGVASAFINGVFSDLVTLPGGANFDSSGFDTLYIGAKPVDSGSTWSGADFFGCLNLISIHNIERSSGYISDLNAQESEVFNQTIQNRAQDPPDNKQREALLSWTIPADFDYEGGFVKIVRKFRELPSHFDDGDNVAILNAESGTFYFLDTYNFIHNADYIYRFFTVNSLDNICDRLEARAVAVHIPKSINDPPSPPLESVSNEIITPGSKKLLLQWSNPSGSEWRGTRVYFSETDFPTISISKGVPNVSNGTLLTDTTDAFIAHRVVVKSVVSGSKVPLTNGRPYFYTIVTYDELNRLSEPKFLTGIPSAQLSTVFDPEDVKDLHLTLLNPRTLSIRWTNPTVKSEELDLFFGEAALCFVSVRDLFGGDLEDITNLRLQFCTEIKKRGLKTTERSLGSGSDEDLFEERGNIRTLGGAEFGFVFADNCNGEEEERETILTYSTVESGLIKGMLTHTSNRETLARRAKYTMNVRAQYRVVDPDTKKSIFEFNTDGVSVTFIHPVKISLINKNHAKINIGCEQEGGLRGLEPCPCENEIEGTCQTTEFNGGYTGAARPYVCRVEIQYKGEALPDGTPISVYLFQHGTGANSHPLNSKSNKTFIREGIYSTSAVLEEELDFEGNPTGNLVSKSIADIEVPAPLEPDFVDIYVSMDYAGLLVDAVHSVKFISSLLIRAEITPCDDDGIDVAEQFATVWIIDPDDPDNLTARLPVPDGTVVKWELQKLQFAKDRPFYSTEPLPFFLSGVYSTTISGVARNVFFGPVGDIEAHSFIKECGTEAPPEDCCIGEEYAITVRVILGDQSATDGEKFHYSCDVEDKVFSNKKFFVNAAITQPSGASESWPHYVAWGDGVHLLHFQIAQDPALLDDTQMREVAEYNDCVDRIVGGQSFFLPLEHIIQITAPGEILWDVVFQEDPYTGEQVPVSYQSISPKKAEELQIPLVANIPVRGPVTDFYLRFNIFIGDDANPKPAECESGGGGGNLNILPCEWRYICDDSTRRIWTNVDTVSGVTTLIINNKEVSLQAAGGYENGIPPVWAGFKEPLDVRIIEARVNGERVLTGELLADNVTRYTFVVEVSFTGDPVPDGTIVILTVTGEGQDVVILSNCGGVSANCNPASNGIIYTRQLNDHLINPDGDKRSFAYFTIEPLPNIAFNAIINVECSYDKLGTVERKIKRCVELRNSVNTNPAPPLPPACPDPPCDEPLLTAATSNECIIYDTVQNNYSITVGPLIRRMAHFAASVPSGTAEKIYVFGGFTGGADNSTPNITPFSEEFILATQEWSFITDMPTGRCAGMTAVKDDIIYCIGGLEIDELLSLYQVSRKIESYNTRTETWNTILAPMPEDYGVAFGDAQVIGDDIYVVCGVTRVVNSSHAETVNDRILKYSILNDTWETITPSIPSIYNRISPFSFNRSNPPSQTFNMDISSLADNATESEGASFNTGVDLITGQIGGRKQNAWLRFRLDVPKKARIINSNIQGVEIEVNGLDSKEFRVYALDRDDFDNFDSDDPRLYNTIPETVDWIYGVSGGSGTVVPDISSIIQAFVNRDGYFSGNHIVIKIDGHTTSNDNSVVWGGFQVGNHIPFALEIEYQDAGTYYVCNGAIAKSSAEIEAERNTIIQQRLAEFRSFILTSTYYGNLTVDEQDAFRQENEDRIVAEAQVPAFVYPNGGFKFKAGSETVVNNERTMDISDILEDEWTVLPMARDRGQCIYIPHQDIAYFMGGANQNLSTTLNRVENIDLRNNNEYIRLSPLGRGRAMFGAVDVGDDIYITGGLTSGHQEGYVEIECQQFPEFIQALGVESSGVLITLRNDSGEIIEDDIRLDIRGTLRSPIIDNVLAEYLARRGADRALGGDGSGNAPDLPEGEEFGDIQAVIKAQNKITDPNSDQFQFNAARKLNEEIFLFPVLYGSNDFILQGGVGGTTLFPRSEDPLEDVAKLSEFINTILTNVPPDPDERFEGNLTREELAALGDVLETIQLPPTIIDAGSLRELYSIETQVTVLDDFYFGQAISEFDEQVQELIRGKIEELLNSSEELGNSQLTSPKPGSRLAGTDIVFKWMAITGAIGYQLKVGSTLGGSEFSDSGILAPDVLSASVSGLPQDGSIVYVRLFTNFEGRSGEDYNDYLFGAFFLGAQGDPGEPVSEDSECFLLEHLADPDLPPSTTPPQSGGGNNPGGTGGFSQSGQSLSSLSLLPLNVKARDQLNNPTAVFYNATDWVPQIKERLIDNTSTLAETIEEIDTIDYEVPFGSSQLYNTMIAASRTMSGDSFTDTKKVIYICSDNSQNLSLVSRNDAIDEVNSIDGDMKVPVVYTVFSTSFPTSLSSQLERAETGDVDKITKATRGQSATLIASGFLDQLLNLTLGSATGGLGYGVYNRKIEFKELTALTALTMNFLLPANTRGLLRYRYSQDGYNFTDYSEKLEGNDPINFIDFFARILDIEVTLTTGFTVDISEYYDTTATGIPKLLSTIWETSGEREDLLFLDKETVLTNVQQVAVAAEGHVPVNAIIDIGVATSNSHHWADFHTPAQPSVREFGKIFMLERTDDPVSIVPIEPLTTRNQQLYVSAYGPWNPNSVVSLLEVRNNEEVPVLSGFILYPRLGQIYFGTRQDPIKVFKLAIVNENTTRVGLRLRNRLHSDSISLNGVGFIYSTNEVLPATLTQVPPSVSNVRISPTEPNSDDTFFALYDFLDLNQNTESGSLISWFKDGKQLLEIQNRTSWTNENLLLSNKLEPNDKIYFSITPSDGVDFGTTIFSPTVIILAREPGAQDVKIVPTRNGVLNNRFDTSGTFTVKYVFNTDDTGSGAVEVGTIIKWFLNGVLFKEGTFSAAEPPIEVDENGNPLPTPLRLLPGELVGGTTAHVIGNQVYVEVTPRTLLVTGETVRSSTIIVENSLLIVKNVTITPLEPTSQSTLEVNYDIEDADIANGTQTDQSEIKWLKSLNGVDFEEQTELRDQTIVGASETALGEYWKVIVLPFDGLDTGSSVESNVVRIQ